MTLALLVLLLWAQPQAPCADLAACRALADEARANKDFEAFHDLAWQAYRKGRNNDAELMLLVARAQSLSGRPGDALVMLERVAAVGGSTDVTTSEDFARVRALPRWEEVAPKFAATPAPATPPPAPPAKEAAPPAKKPAPPAKDPAPPAKDPAPPAKDPAPPTKEPAPSSKSASAPFLKFNTLLTPSAIVHDAVSKRFIIADRKARRIAVVDETTGQVATLVGAQGALGDIGGIAIDAQQGDLWVVTATEEGTVLHRMQLISGRVLSTVPLSSLKAPVTAMAFAHGTGLVVADATGTIWRVRTSGRTDKLGGMEYVPRALAADPAGRLYVAGDAPRLARLSPGPPMRRIDMVEVTGPGSGRDAVRRQRQTAALHPAGGRQLRNPQLSPALGDNPRHEMRRRSRSHRPRRSHRHRSDAEPARA